MDTIVTIIVAIIGSGVLSLLLNRYFLQKDKKNEEKNGTKRAIRLLMKDRMRFLCTNYIKQGWIYEDEFEDLINTHECYHDEMGGNGYLDDLLSRVKNLEKRNN